MDKTLQVQTQIRQNAEEISSALSEMKKWEKQMKKRDENISSARKQSLRVPRAPIRSGVGTVPVKAKQSLSEKSMIVEQTTALSAEKLTPSTIISNASTLPPAPTAAVPRARGSYEHRDAEEAEREHGNAEFKAGNFSAAVKSYTKCLGLKSRNHVAFSNRAMAYLKLKEYARAVSDCTSALIIDPAHVKSLLRRATAYNAQGKHRAALIDLLSASSLDSSNKQIKTELQHTREQLRNAVNRAPLVPLLESSQVHRIFNKDASAAAAEEQENRMKVEGPDFRPPDFKPDAVFEEAAPSTIAPITHNDVEGTTDALHRVTIADDDDDDEEEEAGVDNKINDEKKVASHDEVSTLNTKTPVMTESVLSKALQKQTENTSPVKHPKKPEEVKKTVPTASVENINSSYDLERALIHAGEQPSAIGKVLKPISLKQVRGWFRNLMEPNVLYLQLHAVHLFYGRKKKQWQKVYDWFHGLSSIPAFSLLYSLLPIEQKESLRGAITALQEVMIMEDTAIMNVTEDKVQLLWKSYT